MIVNHVDSVLERTNAIIADKKQQIETIEEYKKSLIFEYVTGKKDVAFSQQIISIHPVVLAAIIIDELGNDLLGKTKLQKGMILCDLMLGLRPNAQYYRYEHGPYDKELENYLKKLNDSKWFIIKNSSPMECYKGKNYLKYEERYENIISEYAPKMKKYWISFVL